MSDDDLNTGNPGTGHSSVSSGSTKFGSSDSPIFLKQTIEGFLDDLSARNPTPGGGPAAAIAIAMAAGLASMAARFSDDQLPGASRIAETADLLRTRVVSLAQEDARAYQEVLASFEASAKGDPATRRERIRSALSGAADVPLRITDAGAEVAQLAEEVARRGNGNLRGDAITGALLAHAGAQACALLVRINLHGVEDERIARAQGLADTAADAARRAQVGDA
ncbi:MAG: cyclodeaminase/cyclohydrolase family protein [Actinomycetota bacterium]|nr:cyclodeaminase/cyclohydrolase family protein [Actinomycetota bacterium]